MTIFILLIVGLIFLFLTGILIACDNRKRKYKKKVLRLHWRVLGIVFTFIAMFSLIKFTSYMIHFDGEECGDRKVLLRTTMELSDVKVPSKDAKLDITLQEDCEEIIKQLEEGNTEKELEYVDALLNKKRIPFSKIHEVKYSKDLTAKQVQMVEYLVSCKDGFFTRPEVYYYIIFGEDLPKEIEKKKEELKKKSQEDKKKQTKKTKKKK